MQVPPPFSALAQWATHISLDAKWSRPKYLRELFDQELNSVLGKVIELFGSAHALSLGVARWDFAKHLFEFEQERPFELVPSLYSSSRATSDNPGMKGSDTSDAKNILRPSRYALGDTRGALLCRSDIDNTRLSELVSELLISNKYIYQF